MDAEKKVKRLRIRNIVLVGFAAWVVIALVVFWWWSPWKKERVASYKIELPQSLPSCSDRISEWLIPVMSGEEYEEMELVSKRNLVCFYSVLGISLKGDGFTYYGIGLDQAGKTHRFWKRVQWFSPYRITSYQNQEGNIRLVLSLGFTWKAWAVLVMSLWMAGMAGLVGNVIYDEKWVLRRLSEVRANALPQMSTRVPEASLVAGTPQPVFRQTLVQRPAVEVQAFALSKSQRKKQRRLKAKKEMERRMRQEKQ